MTAPDPTSAAPARKPRRDAFDGKRKRAFLDALSKGGCLRDAARKAGVSHQTVYNHQRSDRQFARQCELALDMAGTDIELHAWERGVVGVEEPILYRGEIVGHRRKRSDAVLRLLLQATKPKKYGANPGFSRTHLHKFERKRVEKQVREEIRAEYRAMQASPEEIERKLMAKLGDLGKRLAERREQEEKAQHERWEREYVERQRAARDGESVPSEAVRDDEAADPAEPILEEGWAVLAQPPGRGEPSVRFV